MLSINEKISAKVKAAFAACGYEERFGQITVSNRPDLCQFQCNGALVAAKAYKKAPIVIAGEISAILSEDPDFSMAEAVMPGFLNINVSDAFLVSYLSDMVFSEKLGFEEKSAGKTVVVDYGGANVAKPLHVGHLRPAIIGEAEKRLMKFDGFKTIGDVHLGDWGLQMGLVITELEKRRPELPYFDPDFVGEYPSESPVTMEDLDEIYPYASAYSKEHPEYLQKAQEATVLLQKKRPGYYALWKHIMNVSLPDLKKNYDNINVFFELWGKESDASDIIPGLVELLKEKELTHISDGALVVDVKKETDTKEMPPCIILKSDGSSIYASTDLATLMERKKNYDPDRVLYVVDKRQSLHFEQVFRVCKMAGIMSEDTELIFIGNGTMNGPDGKPFKTRSGGVMRLASLVKEISDKVLEKMSDRDMPEEEAEEISKIVGLAALKYGDLSNQATKDYVFDIDRFTSFEGNTGPYILYTMVRIKSILEKYAHEQCMNVEDVISSYKALKLNHKIGESENITKSERDLMIGVAGFSESIRHAVDELAPHKVCSYIFELANLFNSFYHDNKIIAQEDTAIRERWISLSILVLDVLSCCTDLLAIKVPDRM